MNLLAVMIALPIRLYQWCIAPMLGCRCRFVPSCSAYALDALAAHGPVRGMRLATQRVLRCHPWSGQGEDPVPYV